MESEKVIQMKWNRPQSHFILSQARYVDYEGGIRSGKSTALVWKLILYAQKYPGIHMLLTRWTQDALDAQIKPLFWGHCPEELLKDKPWNSGEEYVQFANGSRLYLRALKTSDDSARFSKVAGLTLAVIAIDQPEEIPYFMYLYLKGRLSQPGFPQQMLLTPNPPEVDHWISKEFPPDNSRPNHEYIKTSVYDNRENLGDGYITALEHDYPLGHPMRRTLIDGERGMPLRGDPIYGKIWKPKLHVAEVEPLPGIPILEAWDFGHRRPAVKWSQFTPEGQWCIYGEMQGDNQYLEEFIPQALAMRVRLFGSDALVWSCCDPSGANATSHGTQRTAVVILQEHDINPVYVETSNRADKRNFAIQQIAKLMLRLTPNGPAIQVHPRCTIIIDGFAAGYTYSELYARGNIRKPLKDGYYDNLQNCLEYTILNFLTPDVYSGGFGAAWGDDGRDYDPDDPPARRGPTNSAGY